MIGLKENSNKQTGVVYVRTRGLNEKDENGAQLCALGDGAKARSGSGHRNAWCRNWRTVWRRATCTWRRTPITPRCSNTQLSGSEHRWDDYELGEKIDHVDGMTVEEAEHMLATRLYQNTAKVHFNQFTEAKGRFGKRLIYGGHVISIARALSFNGLANAVSIAAINGGRHVNPLFAGDTVFAWSEVLDKAEIPHRKDVGALRLRLVATKNLPCDAFPDRDDKGGIRGKRDPRFRLLGDSAAQS